MALLLGFGLVALLNEPYTRGRAGAVQYLPPEAGGNQPADTDMSDAALFQNALR